MIMSDRLARIALDAAPAFPPRGAWTPLTHNSEERGAAAYAIAAAIRGNAHYLTLEERSRLAAELLNPHTTDHARDARFEPHENGHPA